MKRFSPEKLIEFKRLLLNKQIVFQNSEVEHEHQALPDENHLSTERTLVTDMGAEEQTRAVDFKLAAHEIEELQMISQALLRIQSGEYGECLECAEPIPEKRLQILPEAAFCVRCEQELENELKKNQRSNNEVDFGNPMIKEEI